MIPDVLFVAILVGFAISALGTLTWKSASPSPQPARNTPALAAPAIAENTRAEGSNAAAVQASAESQPAEPAAAPQGAAALSASAAPADVPSSAAAGRRLAKAARSPQSRHKTHPSANILEPGSIPKKVEEFEDIIEKAVSGTAAKREG